MEVFVEEGKQIDEKCSNLVLPALSIGNVGQLAVDVLIPTLKAERIGYLDDPYVHPCVGNDAYYPSPPGELALPLELYEASSNSLNLLQQRSPVVKGMMVEYAKSLADFAATSGKKHVIVLSSLDFGRWQTIDMSNGSQIYYISSSGTVGQDDDCERLGWKRLQEYNPQQRSWKLLSTLAEGNTDHEDFDELEEEDYYPSLPFAALFSCFKAKGLKVTCLLCYCSEGDNIPDALHLADAATKLLRVRTPNSHGEEADKWIIPLSWQSVYGPPPDMSIF